MSKEPMARTYLVQILNEPYEKVPSDLKPVLLEKKYTNETQNECRKVYNLEYMGSAEFEFGTIPRTKHDIANDISSYVTHSFAIKPSDTEKPWDPEAKPLKDPVTIYVLCRKDYVEEVEERIRELAKGGLRLKERTGMERVFFKNPRYEERIGGWLELNNLFYFFVNKSMFQGVLKLYGKGE